jgi:hypothetical protein
VPSGYRRRTSLCGEDADAAAAESVTRLRFARALGVSGALDPHRWKVIR